MSTSTLKSYFQLVKFRLTSTVAATSAFGYMLGCQLNNRDHWKDAFEWPVFWAVLLGGMLVVFASNGLNQIIEKSNDSMMSRTATRPIVEERISLSDARIFSWVSGLLGLLLLAVFTPFATMLLSLLSLILYVFVLHTHEKGELAGGDGGRHSGGSSPFDWLHSCRRSY